MEDPYRTIRLKRELVDRAERVLLEHPDLGITSLASLVAGGLVRQLDEIERPSQPAPVASTGPNRPGPEASSLKTKDPGPARSDKSPGRGQPSADPQLDEKTIAKQLKVRLDAGILIGKGLTRRERGIAIVQQLAQDQGFQVQDEDAAKLYERALEKGA